MHLVKRIEVFSDSVELGKITEALESVGIASYTIIRNVAVKGLRGGVYGGFDMTALENDYIIAFCPPEQVTPVVSKIRPILNKFGGSCYISDSMEIRSVQCVASSQEDPGS